MAARTTQGQWTSCDYLGKGVYRDPADGDEAVATELAKFIAYMYFSRGNKLATALNRLSAVQYFHRLVGIELLLKHHYLQVVKAGLGREGAIKDRRVRVRRPLTWFMLRQGRSLTE